MRIQITHRTRYAYEPPASQVALRLRLYPSIHDGQRPVSWSVTVNEDTVEPLFTDGFGDQIGLWQVREPSPEVDIAATGIIETTDKAGVVSGLPRRPPTGVFLRTTPLTEPSGAIRELSSTITAENELDRLHKLSEAIENTIDYKKSTTTSETPAADVLELGAGVCQDFAHVFISAARHLGTPTRYVSGYLLSAEDEQELFETHAWAEAFVKGLGWVGFDPSNGLCPTDRYVRLSCGLDANFAAPIRGAVSNESEVKLEANVEIGLEDDEPQESGQRQQ